MNELTRPATMNPPHSTGFAPPMSFSLLPGLAPGAPPQVVPGLVPGAIPVLPPMKVLPKGNTLPPKHIDLGGLTCHEDDLVTPNPFTAAGTPVQFVSPVPNQVPQYDALNNPPPRPQKPRKTYSREHITSPALPQEVDVRRYPSPAAYFGK